jgi:hypothetical protein
MPRGKDRGDGGEEERRRAEGFRALVASDRGNGYMIEDADGEYRYWDGLSREGKLRQIAGNAAYCGVPFGPFAEAVRDALGGGPASGLAEAALRLVLRGERELHALGRLFPDDGGTGPPPPLAERFREALGLPEGADGQEQHRDRGIRR